MIFSELYSAYYAAVSAILARAVRGELDEAGMKELVRTHAFSESALTILPALKEGKWQLLRPDLTTPLTTEPEMPITLLERRWLRAILNDPRIALFSIRADGLEEVEPLFAPEDIHIYDRYLDGDPYGDEQYIRNFRTVLDAIRRERPLLVNAITRSGYTYRHKVMPKKLEYSEKDDKFRLIAIGKGRTIINLARILDIRPCHAADLLERELDAPVMKPLTLRIIDRRNALERVMLHFAHFEKQTERIDEMNYRMTLKYDAQDETEMVIRVLSFGPMVEVEGPSAFRNLIRERLVRQRRLDLARRKPE